MPFNNNKRSNKRKPRRGLNSKNKMKADFSFTDGIRKVQKQVHPEISISTDALNNINAFVNMYMKKLIFSAIKFQHADTTVTNRGFVNAQHTLTSREIQSAAKYELPGELGKHAVSEGTKAVTKYSVGTISGGKHKSGLVMKISRVRNLIKKYYKGRLGGGAPIYLTAVAEYIVAEILELAGNACRDNKRKRITVRDLFLATESDVELAQMCHEMKWVWSGGHIMPYLTYELANLVKSRKKKSTKKKTSKRKNSKNSKRKTSKRKMSKRGKRSGKKSRTDKKRVMKNFGFGLRFGAYKSKVKRHRKVMRDNIQGITKPALNKLTKKAGVYRTGSLIYEELRGIIYVFIEKLMNDIVAFNIHKRKTTITKEDVYEASKYKLYPTEKGAKVVAKYYFGTVASAGSGTSSGTSSGTNSSFGRRRKVGVKALQEIRYYQKHPGLLIPKLPFSRLVREIGQHFKANLHFSAGALEAIQQLTEHHIVDLLFKANLIILTYKKYTLEPKDLHITRRVLG